MGSPCCWDQPRFDFGLVVAKIVKAVLGHDLDLTSLYANENLKLESIPLTVRPRGSFTNYVNMILDTWIFSAVM